MTLYAPPFVARMGKGEAEGPKEICSARMKCKLTCLNAFLSDRALCPGSDGLDRMITLRCESPEPSSRSAREWRLRRDWHHRIPRVRSAHRRSKPSVNLTVDDDDGTSASARSMKSLPRELLVGRFVRFDRPLKASDEPFTPSPRYRLRKQSTSLGVRSVHATVDCGDRRQRQLPRLRQTMVPSATAHSTTALCIRLSHHTMSGCQLLLVPWTNRPTLVGRSFAWAVG